MVVDDIIYNYSKRFKDIDVDTVELTVMPDCKFLRKRYLLDKIPESICLASIKRKGEIIIPNPHTEVQADDELLIFTTKETISKAENLFQ